MPNVWLCFSTTTPAQIVRVALDAVYCLAHFLALALPSSATDLSDHITHSEHTHPSPLLPQTQIVRVALDAVYCLAHFLAPALPSAATAIFAKCGAPPVPIPQLSSHFDNIPPNSTIAVGLILFNKLEAPPAAEGAATAKSAVGAAVAAAAGTVASAVGAAAAAVGAAVAKAVVPPLASSGVVEM